ncbi:hypothetical protein U1Q18_017905, partial [Sarracenia purpurea var. burkii]
YRSSSPPVTNSAVTNGHKRSFVEDESDSESKTRKIITGPSLFSQEECEATEASASELYLDLPKFSEVTAQEKTEDVPSGFEGEPDEARRKITKSESIEEGDDVDSDGSESENEDSSKEFILDEAANGAH